METMSVLRKHFTRRSPLPRSQRLRHHSATSPPELWAFLLMLRPVDCLYMSFEQCAPIPPGVEPGLTQVLHASISSITREAIWSL